MYEVYNSPSVLEAGDDGTNEATLSIELETVSLAQYFFFLLRKFR